MIRKESEPEAFMTVWIGFCKIYEANKKHIGNHDLSDKAFQKIVLFDYSLVAWNFTALNPHTLKPKTCFNLVQRVGMSHEWGYVWSTVEVALLLLCSMDLCIYLLSL